MDDEILIRTPVAEFLRYAGYKVVEAANAAEAVVVFASGAAIDLVFSDVVMPGRMDGGGLARWISDHRPGVPVILTSGVGPPAEISKASALFLLKPYRLTNLALSIASLLRDRPE